MDARLRWVYKRAYDGLNYRLRGAFGGRLARCCRPTSIALMLTGLCTARCVHCDIWKNRERDNSPTPSEWERLLKDLREWLGPVHVFFSGGEALMKPFTIELVHHASRLGLFLEILTHGYWEDQTKIERLALARPWKVTLSLDGVGETHTLVRRQPMFWERTHRTIETLKRMRQEHHLDYIIRLKNVIMRQNLGDTLRVAEYARQDGMEVFYQPIERNYATPEDPEWFLHSDTWPNDPARAISNVRELIRMKEEGYPIANSVQQLSAMVRYFEDPAGLRVETQRHAAHESKRYCSSLTMLQIQPNGDVTVCINAAPVGNIKQDRIRTIWNGRPHFWKTGCCLEGARERSDLVQLGVDPGIRLE